MIRRLLLVAVLTIGMAGCVATPGPGTLLVDIAGEWELDQGTVDGVAIPLGEGHGITLSVHAPSITGTSACNSWGGRLALVDGKVRVTDVSSTAMLCEDDVMASETAFMRAIGLVDAAELDGDRLTMSGPGVELTFSRA